MTFLLGSTCCSNLRSFIQYNSNLFNYILINNICLRLTWMKAKFVLRGFTLILLALSIFLWKFLQLDYVSSLQYQGETINIKRGNNNIPEIHAQSYKSALYAWGYVDAEDRLFQIAFKRLLIQGRVSEYLGQKAVEVDQMFREINLYGWAAKAAVRFEKQNVTEYKNFQAYVQGINDNYKNLQFKPLEFHLIGLDWEQWTMTDTIAIYILLKWSLSHGMIDQYIRSSLLKRFSKEEVDKVFAYSTKEWLKGQYSTLQTIVKEHQIPKDLLQKSEGLDPDNYQAISVQEMHQVGFFSYLDVTERASNSWVIAGKYTDSGHPILCNDPHLDSSLPAQWHQVKIFYPNQRGQQVYMILATTPGVPGFVGKTTYMSMALTVNTFDSQDLFKQKIQGQKYFVDGNWRDMKIRVETIKIKGGQTRQYKVYETHRGPLISHIGFKGYLYKVSEPISLCWTGFTDSVYIAISAYPRFAEITHYQQIYPILVKYSDYMPSFNLLYTTADDHIGHYSIGVVPLRKHPHSGVYVKDGTSSENDWIGFLQGADKLHLEDPERGYIVTANNMAAPHAYFNGALDTGLYTARADRIQKLIRDQIASGRKINRDFHRKVQLDTVDVLCLEVVSGMKAKLVSEVHNYKQIFSVFENFDCDFHTESVISSFYLTFFQNLFEQLHIQGPNYTFSFLHLLSYHKNIYNFILKNHTEEDFKKLKNAMSDSLKQLKQLFQTDNSSLYRYGELHKDLMVHRPFSNSQLKSLFQFETIGTGNMNTPNIGVMYKINQKDYRTNHRANLRLIISYHEDSEWIIDGGTSEKFYSSHYMDQTQLFFAGKYLLMDTWNRTQTVI